jgi:segregation and condensation protein A
MNALETIKAVVDGKDVTALPHDLYIPPDALEVFLETFSGPLDLLLYLIKKQNIDILNIPVSKITKQYMDYIAIMDVLKLELAAEYLVMAAMLCEIKSRMLLPQTEDEEEHEADPKAELVRRLLEYEQMKQGAHDLDSLPRVERDVLPVCVDYDTSIIERPQPEVSFEALIHAFRGVMQRVDNNAHYSIAKEVLSIRERMGSVLNTLQYQPFARFSDLFSYKEGRHGLVVTFIAILELVKQSMIKLVQTDLFSPIHMSVTKNEH